jgi:hypothetical protein
VLSTASRRHQMFTPRQRDCSGTSIGRLQPMPAPVHRHRALWSSSERPVVPGDIMLLRLTTRTRFGRAELTVRDAEGNIIETPPAASRPKTGCGLPHVIPAWPPRWSISLTARDGSICTKRTRRYATVALRIQRYRGTSRNGLDGPQISEERHWKESIPLKPMPLWEARALIAAWLANAVKEVLRSTSE